MRAPRTSKQKKNTQTEDLHEIMQQLLLREYKIHKNKVHFWVACMRAKLKTSTGSTTKRSTATRYASRHLA